MMVYLGASKPLRLVPWDSSKPAFHVTDLGPEFTEAVGDQLGTPFIYYAGAYEGCGCGFQYGQYPESREQDTESPQKREALLALRDYLGTGLADAPEIRVFACWAGDERRDSKHHRGLTPDDLLRDDFYFLEGELSAFRAARPKG